jgi:hypothetical protein
MGNNLVDLHDVGIFVVEVEQVDLVRERTAIETALLDQDNMKSVGIGVDCRCPHASGCAFTANDHGANTQLRQVCDQRGAEKGAGALFGNDDVAGQRLEFGFDGSAAPRAAANNFLVGSIAANAFSPHELG